MKLIALTRPANIWLYAGRFSHKIIHQNDSVCEQFMVYFRFVYSEDNFTLTDLPDLHKDMNYKWENISGGFFAIIIKVINLTGCSAKSWDNERCSNDFHLIYFSPLSWQDPLSWPQIVEDVYSRARLRTEDYQLSLKLISNIHFIPTKLWSGFI